MSSLTTSKEAPALSNWVANVCRLCRARHSRHYADTQTMPCQGVVRDCKSSLCNELFHFLTYVHAA